MRIVADQHIPFIADIFSELGDLKLIPGQDIDAESIKDADVVVVRTITTINEAFLRSSSVSFVGSATAGLDHVDQLYLKANNIAFAHAPGANATSVVEYVLSCLAEFSVRRKVSLVNRTIGIVGVGHVGRELAVRCKALGMNVMLNDPPLQMGAKPLHGDAGDNLNLDRSSFCSLQEVLQHSDIISIHTPLATSGNFATVGLIGAKELGQLKKGGWFIHTARGGICDEQALIDARNRGVLGALALDVWEDEPHPNLKHVEASDIATGHIAGYSIDAKMNGLNAIRSAIVQHFGLNVPQNVSVKALPKVNPVTAPATVEDLILNLYSVCKDDVRFRQAMQTKSSVSDAFHSYRAQYPIRRTFKAYPFIPGLAESWKKGLGLKDRF